MKISIIIPCYNQGHYLSQAIESLLRQTTPPTEIIVIDDGSTDQTKNVCATFPTVQYVYQKNQGVAHARNNGYLRSSGSHLVFLDADDRLLEHALEVHCQLFMQLPQLGLTYGRFRIIDIHGNVSPVEKRFFLPKNKHYHHLLRRNYIGGPSVVMIRREAVQSFDGFDQSMWPAEDYNLYLKIAKVFPILGTDSLVAEYRQHNTNVSANSLRMLKALERVLERQTDSSDVEIRPLVRTAIMSCRQKFGRQAYWQLVESTKQARFAGALKTFIELIWEMPDIFVKNVLHHISGKLKRSQQKPKHK